MIRSALWCAASSLAIVSTLAAQGQITWLEPDGSVRSIAESGGAPTTVLSDVQFLHVTITHWFPQVTTREHTTRLATGAGMEWIELPDNGRLMRYQRDGNRDRGWLWLRADGVPEVVVEVGGDEASKLGDRIAVGNDGQRAAILVGQTDLYVVELDAGTGARVQRVTVPAPVKSKSVTVTRQLVYVQTEDERLLRLRFGTSLPVFEDVTPPTANPVDLEPEMAVSGDGEVVVLVAGIGTKKQMWRLRGLQGPELLIARGKDLQAPDYTQCVAGPTLLLNWDGSRLLFVERTGEGHHGNLNHYEFYVLDLRKPQPALQISDDATFATYIGTGVVPNFAQADDPSASPNAPLLIAMGYPSREDWYSVGESEQDIHNVTQTNGETTPVFEAGKLSPRVCFALSSGDMISMEDVENGRGLRFLSHDGQSSRVIEPRLNQNPMLGASLGQQPARVLVSGSLGDAEMTANGMLPVYRAPLGARLTTSVIGASDVYELMVQHGPATDSLVLLLPSGQIYQLPAPGLRRVTCLPSGSMVFDDGHLTLLQPGQAVRRLPAADDSVVLSGATTHGSLNMSVKAQRTEPVAVGVNMTFDVASVTGGGPFEFSWDFGDGTPATPFVAARSAEHSYARAGHYQVTVTISDGHNRARDIFPQTVHHPLTPVAPTQSSTIVLDDDRARVWCVNADNDSVTAIDTTTFQKILEVPVGPHPRTLAVAPDGSIWVACEDDASIRVLDAVTGVQRARIALPPASLPYGLVMRPDGGAAYVTLRGADAVAVVDPTSLRVLGRVRLDGPPKGIAVTADSRRVFVTRYLSGPAPIDGGEPVGEVYEIDARSATWTRTIPLAFDPGPDTTISGRGVPNCLSSLTISPDGRRLWVPSNKDDIARGLFRDGQPLTFENTVRTIVSQIDLESGREDLPARIDFNNRDMAFALTFSPLGDYVFQALQGSNAIDVRDAYTGRVVVSIENTGLAPQGVLLGRDGHLFVHNFMSRTVAVYDVDEVLSGRGLTTPQLADVVTVAQEKLAPDVLLGKQIFYDAADPRMSRNGYISCASCHQDGGHDGQVWDFTDRGEGLRNTQSLLGKAGTREGNLHWTASFDEVQDFENDMRNSFGGTGFMADALFFSGTVSSPLGQPKAGLSPELDALAAYVSSLRNVGSSPYRATDGGEHAAADRGRALFRQLACASCHSGPDFTDSPSGVKHDVGTIAPGSGRASGGALVGFDTPTLKGLWATAPYLHDGSAPTLLDVLTTRNPQGKHGATNTLSPEQLQDLVAYLRQIDDAEPPPQR